jgi:hypothetical protein
MSVQYKGWGHGSSLTFNVDDGFLEAIIRGFKSGILNTQDYNNLIQCENLEGNYCVLRTLLF